MDDNSDISFLPIPEENTSSIQTNRSDSTPPSGDILFYQTPNENVSVSVYFFNETFWMTQKTIAQLFGVDVSTINYHIKEIYDSKELTEQSTIGIFPIVQLEGSRHIKRNVKHYNLDMIISIGYRVNSIRATKFRQWATNTLKEYIIKGFVINDDMLKNGKPFGKDYFDELLERIKEIRASERRFYQKITDIYSQCSYDYAENQAKRNKLMSMQDWVNKLDAFLNFNDYDILHNSGYISRELANNLALKEYANFRIKQDAEFSSDFDKEIKKYL